MKTTIKDVAELAGVSFKTVSRVVNKEPNVSEETVEKVQAAIRQLNYRPNPAARNLASDKSYSIAYVYDNPNAYYVIDMQKGLLRECRNNDYDLLIHPCETSNEDVVSDILQMATRSNLAGLILSPPLSEMPELLNQIVHSGLPFVGIVSGVAPFGIQGKWLCIDDFQAACDIVNHLIHQGHKRIGFISGNRNHRSTLERERGYLDALENYRLDTSAELRIDGEYNFESGISAMKQFLALANPPTAVFACNDELAAGALLEARLNNIQVPQDMAIAGFENSPFSRQTSPAITTAEQDTVAIARKAAGLLIDTISQSKRHAKPVFEETDSISYCPELVIRDSTTKKPGN
ncbi:LacI family DNA-binding transcriptional regulator [Alteromonas sp. 1_MG-2023]|uniref:LacI family DNA-binding transcriptional regulator n=1 Tax=Alteromonas sp. 1_MG-2023 TaxID=3062669 RepID=UPI0026E1CE46|nr:LacI family DNA-binding transcriptional regulator [Alteromonas sp. 1_MG-2023]MDO6477755.1 LacI family DNA-binding transcriptional regulator [Alteromonas sp. 1_MG-2023]